MLTVLRRAAVRGSVVPSAVALGLRVRHAATISASLVKQLRELTGAPMMDCKNALSAEGVDGNVEKAVDWLRKKGLSAATKKAGRTASQGVVAVKLDATGETAAIVEVSSGGGEEDACARCWIAARRT